ncbi:MAG: hypothetical protein K5840_06845 [Eubacterium sp.]|nr:hypothetical protein [Eubacterium sp.]
MKKRFLMTLMSVMVVGAASGMMLAACGSSSSESSGAESAAPSESADSLDIGLPDESADVPAPPSETADAPEDIEENETDQAEDSGLDEVLREIKSDVWVGTAGASLKAVEPTKDLMVWAAQTDNDEEEIIAEVSGFTDSLSDDEKAEFQEQMEMVYSTWISLTTSDSDEVNLMLEDAGVDTSDTSWLSGDGEAINYVMNAMAIGD